MLADGNEAELVLIPPTPDAVTDDEEVIEDDVMLDEMVNDVPCRIEVHHNGSDEEEDSYSEKVSLSYNWKNVSPRFSVLSGELPSDKKRQEDMMRNLSGKEPLELFLLMYEDIASLIQKESVRYAHQKNAIDFKLSHEEVECFLGILLLSGYNSLPEVKHYWSTSEDLGNKAVMDAMSRNRFLEIKHFLHLNNNDNVNESKDKLFKLRPYLILFAKNIMRFGVFTKVLSIDESMVPYFGRFGCKMFIRGKPVRFGYKIWCLCSSSGYLYSFDVYTGKKKESPKATSLGHKTVLDLLKVCPTSSHEVFFDNFFTDPDLLVRLRDLGFRATGTVRERRTRSAPLTTNATMKKSCRGSFEFCFDRREEIFIVKWKDSNVVTVASNYEGHTPLGSVRRYSQQDKKHVQIDIPKCIQDYNQGMGGVDVLDKLASSYRPNIRGKKWWFNIFVHILNVAVTNAWLLHRLTENKPMSHLDFRRNVAMNLIASSKRIHSETYHALQVPSTCRFQGWGHWPESLTEEVGVQKQLRCASCGMKAGFRCKLCSVTLHPKCFEKYHTM